MKREEHRRREALTRLKQWHCGSRGQLAGREEHGGAAAGACRCPCPRDVFHTGCGACGLASHAPAGFTWGVATTLKKKKSSVKKLGK